MTAYTADSVILATNCYLVLATIRSRALPLEKILRADSAEIPSLLYHIFFRNDMHLNFTILYFFSLIEVHHQYLSIVHYRTNHAYFITDIILYHLNAFSINNCN